MACEGSYDEVEVAASSSRTWHGREGGGREGGKRREQEPGMWRQRGGGGGMSESERAREREREEGGAEGES